jgi:hypothetical protein
MMKKLRKNGSYLSMENLDCGDDDDDEDDDNNNNEK